MANIFPYPISDDTNSNAERKLYKLFQEKLNHEYTVIHSVKWVTRDPKRYGPVGEADFVIVHPKHGVLVIEVKGGGIHLDAGKWYTINAAGEKNSLDKDPVAQADRSVYALIDHLKNNALTRRYTFPTHHAVAFPDIDVPANQSLRPDIPRTIILDRSRLANIQTAIEEIFDFWHQRYRHNPMGEQAVRELTRLLVPKYEINTRIAHIFEDEDEQIKKLTEAQYSTLKLLQMFRRAAIIGGAGTGKTMLAVEKARQLTMSGFKVLLLCYNSNLARWLNEITTDFDGITVLTFHSLVRTAADNWAKLPPRINKTDYFDKAEDVLFDALELIRANPQKVDEFLFDAVVIDEAQDFKTDYWIPIPELLKDSINGILYVFFDDNQRIYSQLSNIPISKEQSPLVLSDNCRNTQPIFKLLQQYTKTSTAIQCIGPEGRAIETKPSTGDTETQKILRSTLHELITEKGALPSQVVILTPRNKDNSLWREGLSLGNFTLTWNLNNSSNKNIRVSTIHSFKGLESPIVILTELDQAFPDTREQLIYIGVSRARNHLIVIGALPSAERDID